jgi:molybdopterin-guanine dinucleotide biosynthesis protein A
MGRDKAALDWRGRPALERAFELLSGVAERAFVSLRADQADDPLRAARPHIVDGDTGSGPVAGIAAAQAAFPEAAWLVLACDLPFADRATLEHLLARRDRSRPATAFRSAHDGLPEPLCALWEPSSREPLLAFVASGRHCPRKFLIESGAALLDLPDPRALENVNTPAELAAARAALGAR